jgi:hypothetical protein
MADWMAALMRLLRRPETHEARHDAEDRDLEILKATLAADEARLAALERECGVEADVWRAGLEG